MNATITKMLTDKSKHFDEKNSAGTNQLELQLVCQKCRVFFSQHLRFISGGGWNTQ